MKHGKRAALFAAAALLAAAVALPACAPPKAQGYEIFQAEEIAAPSYANPYVLRVSPSGTDTGDGSESRPFASLARAAKAAKALQSAPNGHDAVSIVLAEGRYALEEPVMIDETTTKTLPLEILGAAGKQVTLSGGEQFSGLTLWKDGIYRVDVGTEKFREIYVDGKSAVRARYPNAEKDPVGGTLEMTWDNANRTMKFISYDFPEDFPASANLGGVEVKSWQQWVTNVLPVESYSDSGDFRAFSPTEGDAKRIAFERTSPDRGPTSTRGWFENSLSFLDEGGEWFHDVETGMLYYKLRAGESADDLVVTVPRAESLLKIAGSGVSARAKNVSVRNLTFSDTNWTRPTEHGLLEVQAGIYCTDFQASPYTVEGNFPPSAVELMFCENIYFGDNAIKNTASNALGIRFGAKNVTVTQNAFRNIGANAVVAGFFEEVNPFDMTVVRYMKDSYADYVTRDVDVRFNYMKDVGTNYTGMGFAGGYLRDLNIFQNEIDTCSYDAIGIGWGWASPATVSGNFQIKSNRIANTMHSYLNDGGGIYMLGKHRSDLALSEIKDNYLTGTGGCVLYFDDTSSDFVADHNVLDGDNKWGWAHLHDMGMRLTNISVTNTYTTTTKKLDLTYGLTEPTKESRKVFISDPIVKDYTNDWPADAYLIKEGAGLPQKYNALKDR